jgi:thioredoxin reductase
MYDLIIIGGGPTGITAAAIAISQRLETLIVAERWGGQMTYEMKLEDMGAQDIITGETLLDAFRRQLDYLEFVHCFDSVAKIVPEDECFVVNTADGDCFESRALVVATGAKPERLKVPGEGRLAGRGLSYSAVTHASLFLGKDVAVVGGGRRAQWAAASLARKAHKIHLLAPESLVTTPLARKLYEMDNVEVTEGAKVLDVLGEQFVEVVKTRLPDGEVKQIPVKGVFVKLARVPNSELVRGWIDCDERGHVIVDAYCATNWPGVFAGGDVTHISEQVLVHIGEGAKAATSAYHYLLMR